MHVQQLSSSVCYGLELPRARRHAGDEDDALRESRSLNCRTGAATVLARSGIYVYGGLTLPLNLPTVNTSAIQQELILHFAKEQNKSLKFRNLAQWISPEIFFLDLISRRWLRLPTYRGEGDPKGQQGAGAAMKPRLFHSMCYWRNALYVYGGLVVSDRNEYEFKPTNELWRIDLPTRRWTRIEGGPGSKQVPPRYNHQMHINNLTKSSEGPKIVVFGGLDSADTPLARIDVFDLSTNTWENADSMPRSLNLDGKPLHIYQDNSISVLLDDSETEDSNIYIYKSSQNSFESELDSPSLETSRCFSLIKYPMRKNAKGVLLSPQDICSNVKESIENTPDFLPSNLKNPTGSFVNNNLFICGYYPTNRDSENFHCFVYNLVSMQWAKINTTCPDSLKTPHRFWKLLLWNSHHQALLLGTQNNDGTSPTVQKFDYILSFPMSIMKGYNKSNVLDEPSVWDTYSNNVIRSAASDLDNKFMMSTPLSNTSVAKRTMNAPTNVKPLSTVTESSKTDVNDVVPKVKKAFSETSNFENYSQYITEPVDIGSTTSTFPPYAMVLGKDALEIYGDQLADFQFVSKDGDVIGVPLHLLRKRWGRYFDLLLSKAYIDAHSQAAGHGPDFRRSRKGSSQDILNPNSKWSISRSYLEMNKGISNQGSACGSWSSRKSSNAAHIPLFDGAPSILTNSGYTDSKSNILSESALKTHNEHLNTPPGKKKQVTYSSNGISFRIPFENDEIEEVSPQVNSLHNIDSRAVKEVNDIHLKHGGPLAKFYSLVRRASLGDEHITEKRKGRALSPPLKPFIDDHHKNLTLGLPSSPYQSRKASIHSQTSNASLVSSTTSRFGGKAMKRGSLGSGSIGMTPVLTHSLDSKLQNYHALSKMIPSPSREPMEPLPAPPANSNTSRQPRFNRIGIDASHRASVSTSRSYSPSEPARKTTTLGNNVKFTQNFENASDYKSNENSQSNHFILNAGLDHSSTIFEQNDGHDENHGNADQIGVSFQECLNYNGNDNDDDIGNANNDDNDDDDNDEDEDDLADDDSIVYRKRKTKGAITNGFEDVVYLDPLLIPRSLYVPWSTASVKAFAEFFYIGQASGKWLFYPVTSDLLIMAKIYELPLLDSLITEVVYSILAKKEVHLSLACKRLLVIFEYKVRSKLGSNQELIDQYLENNSVYISLLNLIISLQDIDNGFVDTDLLGKVSRAFSSAGMNEGSSDHRQSVTRSGSMQYQRAIGVRHLLSRESQQTFDYLASMAPRNSLAKTRTSTSTPQTSEKLFPYVYREKQSHHRESQQYESNRLKESKLREMCFNSPKDSAEQMELQKLSDLQVGGGTASKLQVSVGSQSNEGLNTCFNEGDDLIGAESAPDYVGLDSLLLDSDEEFEPPGFNYGFEEMVEKVDKALDESVDPLCKVDTNCATKVTGSDVRMGASACQGPCFGAATEESRDDDKQFQGITLEDLATPNAPPPSPQIMKRIYETSIIVNDVNLTLRSVECLQFSRTLADLRKKMFACLELLDGKDVRESSR